MSMKTNKKRILSVLMAVVMLFAMMLPAHAVSYEDEYVESGDYLCTIKKDKTIEISLYGGSNTELVIPRKLDGKKVTSIGDGAFLLSESLTSVTIPETVASIGQGTFLLQEELTSVTMSYGVKSIGSCAFLNCTSLTSVTIPSSVKKIDEYAFGYWLDFDSITDYEDIQYLKVEDFTIYGVAGSAAEKYATENEFTFEPVVELPANSITASNKTLTVNTSKNQTYSIGAKVKDSAKLKYESDNKSVTVDKNGKVTVKNGYVGKAEITIIASATKKYRETVKTITVTVNKAKQPMTVSGNLTLKASDLKKKDKTATIKVSKAQGAVTYKSNSKSVTVDKKGKVTVKKGTKKGKYTITVTAAGNKTYASGKKTVTITVK